MNYKKALLYLEKFTDYEKSVSYRYGRAYSLKRLKHLLSLLDNPHKRYLSIIISGTKGKGSTATMLSSILDRAGIRTAKYTSPHLVSIRERIQIGARLISRHEFSYAAAMVKKAIERARIENLTYFEVLTAIAFVFFANRCVDIAVLEVGLGGRLDATNIAPASIAAMTPISLDHMHILGDSVKEIAQEKSAIIKEDAFVVSAPQPESAEKIIASAALSNNARLFFVGKDIRYKISRCSRSGTVFDIDTPFSSYKNIKISLLGMHQVLNACTAVAAVDILNRYFNFSIRKPDINKALRSVKFPGRFQIVAERPYIILDGAHNKASAEALKDTLKRFFAGSRISLILGISSDKDIDGIGSILCPLAEQVIFTKASSQRAADPCDLAQRLKRFCRYSYVTSDIKDALEFSKKLVRKDGVVVITGSLFLAGDALKMLKHTGCKF